MEASGGLLGRVILIKEGFLSSVDKRIAYLLVEVDITKGLVSQFEVKRGDMMFLQDVDYWKALFKCMVCKDIGHLKAKCPKVALQTQNSIPRAEGCILGILGGNYSQEGSVIELIGLASSKAMDSRS